ncbi:MAG: glycosyltransferase family 9 protein [Calditrichaeota bacterium]|nr:glycosyltransferase family 9 protein [Calditrichota bacterium]
MYERILRIIQRRFLMHYVRKYVKRKAVDAPFNWTKCWDKVKRIAVIWPGDGVDYQAAAMVLGRLRECFSEALITIIDLPGMGASPPPDTDAEVYAIEKRYLNWCGLPDRRLKAKLREMEFDTVVDLAPEFDPISAYYILLTHAPLRIGFAGGKADLVFNYQIAPKAERAGVERYRILAKYIGKWMAG